jgi:hypothetical protein
MVKPSLGEGDEREKPAFGSPETIRNGTKS